MVVVVLVVVVVVIIVVVVVVDWQNMLKCSKNFIGFEWFCFRPQTRAKLRCKTRAKPR